MAYIASDDVSAIRKELKEAFPDSLFSVRKSKSSSSVKISLMKGGIDFSDVLKKGNISLNHYYPDNYNSVQSDFVKKVTEIALNAPARAGGTEWFDDSDSMTDYASTAYYFNIEVGKWDKPYQHTPVELSHNKSEEQEPG